MGDDRFHSNENAAGIPAATVVVFRKAAAGGPPELLMVTRSRQLTFAGGAAVFPGGRVDPADYALAEQMSGAGDTDEAAHRIAAIRETLEETGLVIGLSAGPGAVPITGASAAEARALLLEHGQLHSVLDATGWQLELDAIIPFARWFPKNERIPRVFDTRFYLADLGTGAVDIAVDETENTRLFWITAQGALDAADRGDLSIIYPTRRNLERLAQFSNFADAAADCQRYPVTTVSPFVTEHDGQRWLRIPEDAGYPVTAELLDEVMRG